MLAARQGSAAARRTLSELFAHALARVDPLRIVTQHLPPRPRGRTVVVGAGKAVARMALALERAWDGPLTGLVVTRCGHSEPCERIEVIEAGHPVPDAAANLAALRTLALVEGLGPDDLVIGLMSGGGSSLLALPRPGITLADKRRINGELLRSSAGIGEINTVRKALSAIKGGRLAQACGPAPVCTLVISDAPDDDPATVAGGLTVAARASSAADALRILQRHAIPLGPSIAAAMRAPDEPANERGLGARDVKVIATAGDALRAAQQRAAQLDIVCTCLGARLEGEAREVGRAHADMALGLVRAGALGRRVPHLLLSGGKTTVAIRGHGKGGRNTEFLLGFAIACAGEPGLHALACDTDGIDGSEDNAGAFADGTSIVRAIAAGFDPYRLLRHNDAYSLFARLGDLIVTGPTRTTVNDFRAVLVV